MKSKLLRWFCFYKTIIYNHLRMSFANHFRQRRVLLDPNLIKSISLHLQRVVK